MAQRPVPARRKMNVDMSSKTKLVQSFVGFNSTTVSEDHMQLARDCIKAIQPRSARYEHAPFHMIVQWNQNKSNPSSMIAQACDLLLKYVINLLKPKRPQVWRSIKVTNSHFCARVDCMVGARDILVKIGYSESLPTAMQFPDHVKEPDREQLQVIAAELLMAKLEAEGAEGQSLLMTRQFSGGSQASTPSTPTAGSEPPSLSPSLPRSASPHEHTHVSLTHTNSSPSSSYQHHQSPFTQVASVSENGGVLGSPAQSLQIQPTVAFVPHPAIVGPYEPPTLRNARARPDTPPTTQTQPSSQPTSLNSSGDSNYGTPPSSNSPNTTSELDDSTNASVDYQSMLKMLRKKRGEINEKIKKPNTMATVQPAEDGHTHKNLVRATSYQGLPSQKTVGGPEKTHSPRKAHHSPIIEEEPSINGEGASLQSRPPQPVVSAAPPVNSGGQISRNPGAQIPGNPGGQLSGNPGSQIPGNPGGQIPGNPGGQISGTQCPHCSHIIRPDLVSCDYCFQSVTSTLPPPIHTETGQVRLGSGEPRPTPPLRASAASAEEAMKKHRMTQAFTAERNETGGEASAVAPTSSAGVPGSDEKSYIEKMREKMEVWRNEWKKRGYSDDEIPAEPGSQPLPEMKHPMKRSPPPGQQQQEQQKAKKRVSRKDVEPSKSALSDLERYKREEERKRKMESIGREGESLMECVKFCVKHSYALEEIALAYKKCGKGSKEKVLTYLRQNWAESVRELQGYVYMMVDQNGRSVGVPSDLEARRYLVLSGGDVMTAGRDVYLFRKRKIEELQQKFRPHQELDWKPAVQALSAFDMNVEKAACSIQCDALKPLYDFIYSEWTEVAATDMKNIKERLKKDGGEEAKMANLRMLMGEYKLPTMTKAAMVLDLMYKMEDDEDKDYPLSYYIDAARDYSSMEDAERGLIKQCPICYETRPVHETITMPGCTDTLCKDCFRDHFTVVITEKGVKHFNCPLCDQPDMTNRDDAQDLYQELFVQLVQAHLPLEHYNLMQGKLAERNLQKEPGFRWCANDKCGNCFINLNLDRKKIQCPYCAGLMCFQCKKPWKDQHQGLSCEGFADWERQNDPRFQKEGLAAHLQANGIECPDCHMRYELARGGCMHFKCTRCPNEFCSGCGGSFKKAQACGRFQSCLKKGLHAHHPRDCLYFMRDFGVDWLQAFLRENKVDFETQPAPEQLEAAQQARGEEDGEEGAVEAGDGEDAPAQEGEKAELKCSVMLQKELVDKLVDEPCGDPVKDGHAGLCEKHYKEYLVDRINKAQLDPLPLYEKDGNIEIILKREEKPVPEKEEDETDDHYKQRLIEHIKREVPLQRGAGAQEPQAVANVQEPAQ